MFPTDGADTITCFRYDLGHAYRMYGPMEYFGHDSLHVSCM